MEQKLINMMGDSDHPSPVQDTTLSFKPYLDFIRTRLTEESTIKKDLLQYVLKRFAEYPELEGNVNPEALADKQEILNILYASLSNVSDDETTYYWGLSLPMTPITFYGTTPFYDLLEEANLQLMNCEFEKMDETEYLLKKLEHFYSVVMDKFYGIQFKNGSSLVRSIIERKTGLTRHYQVNIDNRFVEIHANGPLPVMNLDVLRGRLMDNDAIASLREFLPPEQFSFSGFSVITIEDVTAKTAVDSIRNKIINGFRKHEDAGFPEVVQSLKELISSNEIEFNILPFYKVNGKLVEDLSLYAPGVLFEAGSKLGCTMEICMPVVQKFLKNPHLIFYGDLEVEVPSHKEINELFKYSGISSYSLVPVNYNGNLVGALEIYSRTKGRVNEKVFSKLEPAMLLIAQLMHNTLTAFDNKIEKVIKEKFTTLQPPVQWKFNEVAWKYIENKKRKGSAEPDDIYFDNVYPLYGAVDIRNSTIERNAALAEDLKVQFRVLSEVLIALKTRTGFGLLDEKIFSTQSWLKKIENSAIFSEEIRLNDFLENEMMPFLAEFVKGDSSLVEIAKPYFDSINETDGIAQLNRRELETSMTTVISAVNNYFEMLRDEIQQAYPCYFDKFRTDGVEYDIYIGQSITPDKPYSDIYLKNLRLLQLSSMATIAKYSHSLKPLLSRPVETTQLIFIHSHPIDIRFRRDEKRFDVEGAYNIRYHIIKKRIDKVHIRNSSERLTQPDKIALVYFNQKEADEYINYIHYLQGEGILNDDLETLELEELQGVSGLKALRVGVKL